MGTDAAGSRAGRAGGGEEAGGRPREGFEGRGLRGTPDSWLHPEAGAAQHCRMPAARSWLGPGGPRREQGAPRVRTQTEGRPLETGARLRVHAAEPCGLLPPLPRPLAQTGSPHLGLRKALLGDGMPGGASCRFVNLRTLRTMATAGGCATEMRLPRRAPRARGCPAPPRPRPRPPPRAAQPHTAGWGSASAPAWSPHWAWSGRLAPGDGAQ